MITRFFLWWEWRCLVVSAYLAYHTYDTKLAEELENQARSARNKLDDHIMNMQYTK